MKHSFRQLINKPLMTMLVLVWTIAVGCTPTQPPTDSTANPQPQPGLVTESPTTGERTAVSQETLSPDIQQAILKEIGTQQNVAVDQLQITSTEAADWPDACLGLAGPDEMCAQMITPGWALTVTDGQQTWQYRTDLDALQVKQAS